MYYERFHEHPGTSSCSSVVEGVLTSAYFEALVFDLLAFHNGAIVSPLSPHTKLQSRKWLDDSSRKLPKGIHRPAHSYEREPYEPSLGSASAALNTKTVVTANASNLDSRDTCVVYILLLVISTTSSYQVFTRRISSKCARR